MQMVEGRRGGLSETAQRGLDLRVASTSVRTVASTSSSTRLSSSIAFRAVRKLRMQPFLYPTGMSWAAETPTGTPSAGFHL